jgi:heme exporter protein A
LLSAHGLACRRGHRWLFRDLHLSLLPGQRLHLRGANGAGKTSLLRLLSGVAQPESGTVARRSRLLYIAHTNAQAGDLTLTENLAFQAALGSAVPAAGPDDAPGPAPVPVPDEALQAALAAFGLQPCAHAPTRTLSQGQRRRGALARLALPGSAPVWLLDEPHAALDSEGCAQLDALIARHAAQGGAVLLTGHHDLALPGLQALDLAVLAAAQRAAA